MTFAAPLVPAGNLAGAQHDGVARHLPRQDDRFLVDRDPDVFAGKQLIERLLQRGHAGIDDDVVLRALRAAPDDQADGAGALAVDQHLPRLHDDRVGNRADR